MEVKVVSKKLVKPITPTPQNNLCNFKISFFDQNMIPNYIHLIFYYLPINNDGGVANSLERRNKLEQSLSEILTFYFPLAGRYLNNKLSINCDDSGVEFLEANVGCKLSRVLDGEFNLKQLDDLVPDAFESESTPLVLVQCNVFECGGIAIGVSLSHRLADGFTFTTFVNGWAIMSKEGKDKVKHPSFELPSLFPTIPGYPASTMFKPEEKATPNRFIFSGTTIESLKSIANTGNDGVAGLLESKFSRVEVVSALIWKALIAVSQTIHGQSRPSFVLHGMNMRQKVVIPIPDNSCGNFGGMAFAKFEPDDDKKKVELYDLACEIRRALKSTATDMANASNLNDFCSMVTRNANHFKSYVNKGDVYVFSSWCGFPIYSADFGWGKPAWVSLGHLAVENTIFLLDSKHDDGGIEVWVTLDENNTNLFQQNPDIRAFTFKEAFYD